MFLLCVCLFLLFSIRMVKKGKKSFFFSSFPIACFLSFSLFVSPYSLEVARTMNFLFIFLCLSFLILQLFHH
jgi:hypothetical protein